MYRKLFLFVSIVFMLLTGCTDSTQLTKNEDLGIREIANFYAGNCEYSIGAESSASRDTGKYFEIKLSQSNVANNFANLPEFTASNMAYLFYSNLKSERKSYDQIHSVIMLKGDDKYESKYSTAQLDTIATKLAVFNKAIASIKAKNYDALKAMLSDSTYTGAAKNQLIEDLQKADPVFGDVKGLTLYGFRFETKNGVNGLNILGVIVREKKYHPISILVDLKPSDNKIGYLAYSFPPK